MNVIDIGSQVRKGEELDLPAVDTWLKSRIPNLEGSPLVTQYTGGASNWTYRIQYKNADLILRRPPYGTKASSAHDMQREYTIQKVLKPFYGLVPEMVDLCTDHKVIGCDFYIMKRIEGIIPRANLPELAKYDTESIRLLCKNMIDELINLHNTPFKGTDLEVLAKGEGYCHRQVNGWIKRYKKAQTPDVPSFESVFEWLIKNTPEDIKTTIIHNDWRFDNLILDKHNKTEIIGVLDWELATLGDPLMDLGCSLAYWVQDNDSDLLKAMRRQPTHLKGMFSRDEVVHYYLDKAGLKIDNWSFYEIFGLFRLATIAQQIYYRYYNKETENEEYKNFGIFVNKLYKKCLNIINKRLAK